MPYRRGDVVLVIWPNSDGVTYKQRPALIVQADNLKTSLRTKLCAMITSVQRTGDSCTVVEHRSLPGQHMGLKQDSVVMTDQLLVVHEVEIKTSMGRCTIMGEIDQSLRRTVAL